MAGAGRRFDDLVVEMPPGDVDGMEKPEGSMFSSPVEVADGPESRRPEAWRSGPLPVAGATTRDGKALQHASAREPAEMPGAAAGDARTQKGPSAVPAGPCASAGAHTASAPADAVAASGLPNQSRSPVDIATEDSSEEPPTPRLSDYIDPKVGQRVCFPAHC